MTDAEALALGRAIEKLLREPGEWPKLLAFECLDHKRRIDVAPIGRRVMWSDPLREDVAGQSVVVQGGLW